jgi:ubiquinone/menaquinone biosynthesis C-methylase UbiE
MSISVIYKSPWLYEAFLILRYRGEYLNRSRAIAELIPEGSSVVDLCCGPATLYFGHLRHKGVAYLGLDINEGFRNQARQARGLQVFWTSPLIARYLKETTW